MRKAFQNEFLILPQEIREKQELLTTILQFIWDILPEIIKSNFPLEIMGYDNQRISPYELEIRSFKKNSQKFFMSREELIKNLDLDTMARLLQHPKLEIIGIDESKVEIPFQGSTYAYLKSVAFRIYKTDNGQKEAVGPIVRDLKISFRDDPFFEKEAQFWGYLRNLFIAIVAIEESIKSGYHPVVFLHGPLVRAIGGFTDIFLTKEDAERVLSLEIITKEGVLGPDSDEGRITQKNIGGESWLRELHEEETSLIDNPEGPGKVYAAQIIYSEILKKIEKGIDFQNRDKWENAIPYDVSKRRPISFEERKYYSGITLYFWLLRKLYNICKEHNVPLIAVVENIERSTEFVQYVLPPLFLRIYTNPNSLDRIPAEIISLFGKGDRYHPSFDNVLKDLKQGLYTARKDFYWHIFKLIKAINITDSVIVTNILTEGDYTTPIQTHRYETRDFFESHLGHAEYGIKNDYGPILEYYFSSSKYRVVFSYLRSTPLREPIRVEFFDIYENYHEILGATYLLALLYPNYGLPIVLYYTDKVARTHSNYFKKALEYVLVEILKEGWNVKAEKLFRLFKNELFTRNFWSR